MQSDRAVHFPDYEVLNALIEAAKRNQNAVGEATQALRDAIKMFEDESPLPHYDVLNALIEAAKRNQGVLQGTAQDLSALIKEFDARTSNLANNLLEPVATRLLPRLKEEFAVVTQDARYARDQLQRVAKISAWKLFLIPSICFTLAYVALCVYLYFTIPRGGQLETLALEKQGLEKTVAVLEAKGGKADLSSCGPSGRLCVRTDENQGVFGSGSKTYRIIYGY